MTTAIAMVALAGGLVVPPLVGFDPYWLYILGAALLWAALASAWNLLALAGLISFGHAVYFGAGAYASALLAQRAGWNPWLGVLAAAAVGALVALPIGLSAHRLGGAYLALATFAYAEGVRGLALNWTALTGGGAGLIGIPALPPLSLALPDALTRERAGGYYLALTLLLATLGVYAGLRRTRVGLAWAALREREERAQLLGVPPTPYKLLAFACSGALTGVGGALYAHAVRALEPDLAFGRGLSILPLVMASFGGVHTLLGPTVGAFLLYLASELVFQPALPRLHQLPYALALVVVAVSLPRGLAGLGQRWWPGPDR
ncbi:MAG TPA: branched-chain amino acid ABC transporter permease [Methylomirabilota bacterium]|jgi:branched-chain amino acid transport system permease protein|nr:branched-chain amino acid ABC transporter permease [Methylomirabilota bacterium]